MKRSQDMSLPLVPREDSGTWFPPRLEAIDDVYVECPPSARSSVRWFYGELIGLPEQPPEVDLDLCFSSELLRLQIRVTAEALPSPNRRRAVLRVWSLAAMVERLTEKGFACHLHRGLSYFDRWVSVLDPAGNLIELREERLL